MIHFYSQTQPLDIKKTSGRGNLLALGWAFSEIFVNGFCHGPLGSAESSHSWELDDPQHGKGDVCEVALSQVEPF